LFICLVSSYKEMYNCLYDVNANYFQFLMSKGICIHLNI